MRAPKPIALLLIAAFVPLCWLATQAVHELGHVLGATLTGGRVRCVHLHPLAISRTDVLPNPHPRLVVWAGPLVGCLVPLAAWLAARAIRFVPHLFRFFAGFCLVANGAYIGTGVWFPVGDAAVMRQLDDVVWPLATYGLVTTMAGFLLWHGEGRRFGIGSEAEEVSAFHVAVVALLLAGTVVLELLTTCG